LPGKFREIVEENIRKVLDVEVINKIPLYFDVARDRYRILLHSRTSELERD
jgi:hypothetical protein